MSRHQSVLGASRAVTITTVTCATDPGRNRTPTDGGFLGIAGGARGTRGITEHLMLIFTPCLETAARRIKQVSLNVSCTNFGCPTATPNTHECRPFFAFFLNLICRHGTQASNNCIAVAEARGGGEMLKVLRLCKRKVSRFRSPCVTENHGPTKTQRLTLLERNPQKTHVQL